MTIKLQLNNEDTIWISIEEVNVYSESKNEIEHTEEYICYLKFTEPNILVSGEIIKDENNKPLIFNSKEEAIEYVKQIKNKI
jgi:hypothetical protein